MITVKPFIALRPGQPYVRAVAALPYDVMDTEEARLMAEGNPHSFLHVDKAEIDLPKGTDPYSPEVYKKAKENMLKMINDDILIQDEEESFYIYKLISGGHSQCGFAACVSVDEYESGLIKRHELTRPEKEQDRIKHMQALSAHTGPIFMAYRNPSAAGSPRDLMANWINGNAPIYDFTAEDGIRHSIWKVNDTGVTESFKKAFEAIPGIYIADGHHRNEAAYKTASDEIPESKYYLAVIFPHDELAIMDYNRVVKDLNGMDEPTFLKKLEEVAEIAESPGPVKPAKKNTVGMYLKGKWYSLTLKPDEGDDYISRLDVSLLQNKIISPVLAVDKQGKGIDFVGGVRGLKELERLVDSGEWAVAFSMYPTSMEELMTVADNKQIMPPKSTWFEPKLRSGLLIHQF